MYSGAIFIQQTLRVNNLYVCLIFLLLLTAVCTLVGGLAAVIYTDTLQFFIMIGGSLFLIVKGIVCFFHIVIYLCLRYLFDCVCFCLIVCTDLCITHTYCVYVFMHTHK